MGVEIQKQIIFVGSIPVMNSHGIFVVNGVVRVTISQNLQSPSIYYNSEPGHNIIPIYTNTTTSDWGWEGGGEGDIETRN